MTELHGRHIAITRPENQAKRLSELILAAGGTTVSFPLIAISALEDYQAFEAEIAQLPAQDMLIFISSNAVQHAMPRLLARFPRWPAHTQCAAIGPVTAAELGQFGIQQVLQPAKRFDSESLLAMDEMQAVEGKNIMIVRGVGGRELLADTLRQRGAKVSFAECYRRINPQSNSNKLQGLWQNGQLDSLVVTSSEAMRHLLALTANGSAEWLQHCTIHVNHARIAELPMNLGLRVLVADAPGDEAMLHCLSAVPLA